MKTACLQYASFSSTRNIVTAEFQLRLIFNMEYQLRFTVCYNKKEAPLGAIFFSWLKAIKLRCIFLQSHTLVMSLYNYAIKIKPTSIRRFAIINNKMFADRKGMIDFNPTTKQYDNSLQGTARHNSLWLILAF